MKKTRKTAAVIGILAIAVLSFGCGERIPVREMSLARMEITRAKSVRADKYAPVELGEATTLLLGCHDLIKNEDMDEAKQGAVDAFNKARAAYEKSLPLLAKDTMEVAEKSLSDADEANADMLAKNEYGKAREAFKTAGDNYESKKYYESYEAALEADKLAKSARNTALGKRSVLKGAIAEVDSVIGEAEKLDAEKYSPDKLEAARENNRAASEALDELQLKKGFAAVEVAKTNADEAYLDALKGSSADELALASAAVDNAANSKNAALAKDELEASREALARAREAHDEGRYRESLALSGEAVRMAGLVEDAHEQAWVAEGSKRDAELEGDGDYKYYKVKYNPSQRDCLWRISGKYYGNPRLWPKIYEANRGLIRNPNLIKPGWTLKIPTLKPAKGDADEKLIDQDAIRKEGDIEEEIQDDDVQSDETEADLPEED